MQKIEKNDKFNYSDWLVIGGFIALILGSCGFFLFQQFQKVNTSATDIDENSFALTSADIDVRGNEILSIFINKKSDILFFYDDDCLSDSTCQTYLENIQMLPILIGTEAKLYNIDSAKNAGDTNVASAISIAKISQFPTLLIVKNGVETLRHEGMISDEDFQTIIESLIE